MEVLSCRMEATVTVLAGVHFQGSKNISNIDIAENEQVTVLLCSVASTISKFVKAVVEQEKLVWPLKS